MEEWQGNGSEKAGRWEGAGRVEGEDIIIRISYVRRDIFSIEEKNGKWILKRISSEKKGQEYLIPNI